MDDFKKICEEGIESIEDFLSLVQKIHCNTEIKNLVYRGQAQDIWEFESSASRRIKYSFNISEVSRDIFIDYHDVILNNARLKGFHKRKEGDLYDLELIAELQHYSAATCLIDCSYNPLVALWFACSDYFEKDGAIFIVNVADNNQFNKIDYQKIRDSTLSDLLFSEDKKNWYWNPSPTNMRIPYQNSIFIFGFPKLGSENYVKFNIKKEFKKCILEELESYHHIKLDTLFNDLHGYSIANNSHSPILESFAMSLYQYGLTAYQNNNFKDAIQYFDRSIKAGYHEKRVYYHLICSKFDHGEYEEAIQDINFCLEQNILDKDVLNIRAECYISTENYVGAINDYNELIQISPNKEKILSKRAECYISAENYVEAIKDYTELIHMNTPNTNYIINQYRYLRANAFKDNEQYDEAILDYNDIDLEYIDNLRVLSERAFCYKCIGNMDKMYEDIQVAKENASGCDRYDTFMIYFSWIK